MKKAASFLLQLIIISSLQFLNAENFRVMQMHEVSLSTDGSKAAVTAGINDGIRIQLPDDRRFLQGMQIDLHIPKQIASLRDSVALTLWTDCQNGASEIDFRGNKVFLDTVPPRLSQTFQLEFDGRSVKKDPYAAVIPYVVKESDSSVVLRFQLAMKGVPADVFDALFNVEIKAILSNEGLFTLDFEYPDNGGQPEAPDVPLSEALPASTDITEVPEEVPLLVYIDEVLYEDYTDIVLPQGMHHLSVVSENYRNEVRTFTVEQAKATLLTVELKTVTPELYFAAPENAVIYLDDVPVTNKDEKQLISTGSHVVRFVLSDYELTKYFEAVSGRTYTMSLSVSLEIIED